MASMMKIGAKTNFEPQFKILVNNFKYLLMELARAKTTFVNKVLFLN